MLTSPEIIIETDQSPRLSAAIPRWLDRVPLYRRPAYASAASALPAGLAAEDWLADLPCITKKDLREGFPQNFLGDDQDLDALVEKNLVEIEHTSGTAEDRTALLLGYGWWAKQEQAALRQNKFVAKLLDEFPDARRVTINSPVCNNDICYTTVPSRAERLVGNALFLSLSRHPFLWSDDELARMADEAIAWQPLFLDLDPVYGVVFARYCERKNIRLPSVRFIICSYEFTSVAHRRILERVFGVPIFNLYGATETGHLLMENERGEMIPSPETAFLEVVETDAQGVGELVVTTLANEFMPLIRYRIGDLVERRDEPEQTTYVVHGREKDAFVLADATRVSIRQIDDCFAGVPGILHYQLIQSGEAQFRLLVVADDVAPTENDLTELKERLQNRLGVERGLKIETADFLMGEGSGKFRLCYPQRQQQE
jgi:phenylacetate-CoA ligase